MHPELWEGLLLKMEEWISKPYQEIKAMFISKEDEDYVMMIKGLEAENIKLSS